MQFINFVCIIDQIVVYFIIIEQISQKKICFQVGSIDVSNVKH